MKIPVRAAMLDSERFTYSGPSVDAVTALFQSAFARYAPSTGTWTAPVSIGPQVVALLRNAGVDPGPLAQMFPPPPIVPRRAWGLGLYQSDEQIAQLDSTVCLRCKKPVIPAVTHEGYVMALERTFDPPRFTNYVISAWGEDATYVERIDLRYAAEETGRYVFHPCLVQAEEPQDSPVEARHAVGAVRGQMELPMREVA